MNSPDVGSLTRDELEVFEQIIGRSIYMRRPDFEALSLRFLDLTNQGLEDTLELFLMRGDQWYTVATDYTLSLLSSPYENIDHKITYRLEHLGLVLEQYIEDVDKLQDQLFDGHVPRHARELLFRYKQDFTRMERIFMRCGTVLSDFCKFHGTQMGATELEFHSLINFMALHEREATNHLKKLDAMHSFFLAIHNDRLNNNIYLLALVSGIFLPLNFIVGFFGMNTPNLFFSSDEFGTYYVGILLIAVFALLVLGLPLLRLTERYVIRRLLGRFHFYKVMVKRVAIIRDSQD